MNNKGQSMRETVKIPQQQRLHLLNQFVTINTKELGKNMVMENMKATVIPADEQLMPIMGEMIKNGQLVSFPTQTVYGLGADATNENALLEIYRVKKRPLTDPIIVHVLDFQSALKHSHIQSQTDRDLFRELTQQFWPGPLTVIVKANLNILPAIVTAQTGFVGIRSPKAPIARRLIQLSNKPIGAPSANLFSHVSPTSAVHVFNDFYDQELAIIDGPKCQYGVQSTVVKIVDGNLYILREGSFSTKKLIEFVDKKFDGKVKIQVIKKSHKKEENLNMQAPGQLLKHYAPYLPCYYVQKQDLMNSKQEQVDEPVQQKRHSLKNATLISFSDQFNQFQSKFKFFLDSRTDLGDQKVDQEFQEDKFCTPEEKKQMRCLYHLLRKAENLETTIILIGWHCEKQGTLWDKIYRATQGAKAMIF